MRKPASVQPAVVPVVRVLRLKRRPTNVPWIYSLYHADPKPRRRRARESGEGLDEEMAGLDAAALSRALYGDREHVVTVRVEMSRLRRTLGGLLLARPYRIAPDVAVVAPDPAATPLLCGSDAPGIRRLVAQR